MANTETWNEASYKINIIAILSFDVVKIIKQESWIVLIQNERISSTCVGELENKGPMIRPGLETMTVSTIWHRFDEHGMIEWAFLKPRLDCGVSVLYVWLYEQKYITGSECEKKSHEEATALSSYGSKCPCRYKLLWIPQIKVVYTEKTFLNEIMMKQLAEKWMT